MSCQVYGDLLKSDKLKASYIDMLAKNNPGLRIAYVDGQKGQFFSVLLKYDPEEARMVEEYRIRVSGVRGFGDGTRVSVRVRFWVFSSCCPFWLSWSRGDLFPLCVPRGGGNGVRLWRRPGWGGGGIYLGGEKGFGWVGLCPSRWQFDASEVGSEGAGEGVGGRLGSDPGAFGCQASCKRWQSG